MKRNFLSSYRRISCVKGKDIQANIICLRICNEETWILLHVLNLGTHESIVPLIWDDRLFYFYHFKIFSKEGEFHYVISNLK